MRSPQVISLVRKNRLLRFRMSPELVTMECVPYRSSSDQPCIFFQHCFYVVLIVMVKCIHHYHWHVVENLVVQQLVEEDRSRDADVERIDTRVFVGGLAWDRHNIAAGLADALAHSAVLIALFASTAQSSHY